MSGRWRWLAERSPREAVRVGYHRSPPRVEHPVDPQYFSVVDLVTIEELVSLVIWQSRLGSKSDLGHHLGEAEVATVAETHVMTAIIDDRKGSRCREALRPRRSWCALGHLARPRRRARRVAVGIQRPM